MEFATKFNPRPSVGIEFVEPSMAEQHFKEECDINNIVQRYQETGVLPQGNREPLFGDFAEYPQDLQSSQAYFDKAGEAFMQLPATLRKEFDNSPVKLLEFLHDERNRDRAVSLGLINPPAEQVVHQAQAAPAATPAASSQVVDNVQSEQTNVIR